MIVGLGFTVFLTESHYFHFKENIGRGTNNIGEFIDIILLAKFGFGQGFGVFIGFWRLSFGY
jgi:hypothetical protein